MSVQLEVIKFRDLIAVSAIPRFVPNVEVPTLELIGEDFNSVESVFINEIKVPEFIILNKTKMWAQLPNSVTAIQSVEVISSDFTVTGKNSRIDFRIGNTSKRVTGVLKLTQLFTKWMLQSPGSDIFNPEYGGGLQQVVGSLAGKRKIDSIIAAVSRAIDQTASQIRSAQSNGGSIPLSERLLSASLLDASVFDDRMQAIVRVQLTSMTGDSALSALSL
jgi:hypothetical protein